MQARHRPRAVPVLLALGTLLLLGVTAVRVPAPMPGQVAPPTPAGDAPVRVGLDGLVRAFAASAGLELGQDASTLQAPWRVAPGGGTGPDGACRAVSRDDGDVVGWVVDGSVASVGLLRRDPEGVPARLATWVPEATDALLGAAEASPAAREQVVPSGRSDLRVLVRVVRVPVGGHELVLSDLGRPDGRRWAELRTPDGARCAVQDGEERRLDATGPMVGPDGAGGGLVFGAPLSTLVEAGLAGGKGTGAAPGAVDPAGDGCVVLLPGRAAPAGVSSLVVRGGVLVGLGLSAGSVRTDGSSVLTVGDPPARVAAAFPGRVGPGGLQAMRDNSGLVVRLDESRVVVSVARPSALVDDVDVPVLGDPLVASLQLTRGC